MGIIITAAFHCCYYPIDDGSISLIVILVELERREEAARTSRYHCSAKKSDDPKT